MRSEAHLSGERVAFQAQQTSQQRRHHHGGRPDLMRRRCRQRRVPIAGQHLGGVAAASVQREPRIRPQVGERSVRLMIAILAHCGPACEQRPHRAEVIAGRVVERAVRRDDAHPPVGGMLLLGKQGDHLLRVLAVQQVEPHGDGGENTGLVHGTALHIKRKRVPVRFRQPEAFVQRPALLLVFGGELPRAPVVIKQARQSRQRTQRLHIAASLVKFHADREQRPALHPTVAHPHVSGKTRFIEGGSHKLECPPQAWRLLAREGDVTTCLDIVAHGDGEQRCGVGRGVSIGELVEPVDETRRLRDLVRDPAVFALETGDEANRRARIGEVANGSESERGPERVAPEEPGEARAISALR
jgi:hypothetical protein